MDNNVISNRFGRQYGLVHQDKIEDLNILVIGDNPALQYLLLNLAFCGIGSLQGGVYLKSRSDTINEKHVANSILFRKEDIGRPLIKGFRRVFRKEAYDSSDSNSEYFFNVLQPLSPLFDVQAWPDNGHENLIPDVTIFLPEAGEKIEFDPLIGKSVLVGQITNAGVYVGHHPIYINNFIPNVLTPALASLCGALLAQEILRITNSIRSYSIIDQDVEVNLRLKHPDIDVWKKQRAADSATVAPFEARIKLGGEKLSIRYVGDTDEPSEAFFAVKFPKISLFSRLITDSIELIEEPLKKGAGLKPPIFISFLKGEILKDGVIINTDLPPIPDSIEKLNALIVGIGGLGTWLSALLSASSISKFHLTLVDSDNHIEEHNLNRQILYTEKDIGKSKVFAAKDALLRLKPETIVHTYNLDFDDRFLDYINSNISLDYMDPLELEEFIQIEKIKNGWEYDRRDFLNSMLCSDFTNADIILSCLDNMKTRDILNSAAWIANKIFINGGIAGGFTSQVDYVDTNSPFDPNLFQKYGIHAIKKDTRFQCGGSIPIPAIVTSNALTASVQALLSLISALSFIPEYNSFVFHGKCGYIMLLRQSINSDEPLENMKMRDYVNAMLEEMQAGPCKRNS